MSRSTRILLVANRTAAGEPLLEITEERARRATARFQAPAHFHLVVPATPTGLHRVVDPEVAGREAAAEQLERALGMLKRRVDARVTGEVGDADPLAAIQDAIGTTVFDEIVISTLPRRISRWLRLDLVSKARGLGLPVTHVETGEARTRLEQAAA
jgi:hypothetical protein